MEQLEKLLRERCPALELRRDESMSKHTTFRIGGRAALMALPTRQWEAVAAMRTARELGIEPFILGNGSNLLVADEGYPGFIIKLTWDFDGIREVNCGLEAGSAVLLSRLSNALVGRGLTGLEFAGGIPGSVGGAVTMNAGAYGGEMAQVLESVTFLDETGAICTLPASECGLGYRKSIFSDRKCLILEARFHLDQGDPAAIKVRMEELTAKRREKQPLEYPSAGSTFKRPEGHFAGKLIMEAGFAGYRIGGAQVSEKHCGFVINTGDATARDVRALIEEIQARVKERFRVDLEPEIVFLG